MQRIVSEPVKRFHDRARAGKLSSVRGLFWCAMQRIVSEPVKRFHDRARAGKLSSVRGLFWCAMQRIVHQKSRSTELNLALVAD
jgi:hypothetical protein